MRSDRILSSANLHQCQFDNLSSVFDLQELDLEIRNGIENHKFVLIYFAVNLKFYFYDKASYITPPTWEVVM